MPRRKAATSLDEKLTTALEDYYNAQADYLANHVFEEALGAELKKMQMACASLEARTRATAGPQDPMSAFYAAFEEGEGTRQRKQTVAESAVVAEDLDEAVEAAAEVEETVDGEAGLESSLAVADIEEEEAIDEAVRQVERDLEKKARARKPRKKAKTRSARSRAALGPKKGKRVR